MYIKIGDLKLLNIEVRKDGELLYQGKVEEVPQELKEINYKSANFDNGYVKIEI